jgi:hypothetical protein
MTEKCPTCGRAIRKKKVLTPDQEFEARLKKIRAGINANLRKPMPKATVYKL